MELAGLRAEIEHLKVADLPSDPARLAAGVLELEQAVNELMGQKSRWLAEFDRVEGFREDGQTSAWSEPLEIVATFLGDSMFTI